MVKFCFGFFRFLFYLLGFYGQIFFKKTASDRAGPQPSRPIPLAPPRPPVRTPDSGEEESGSASPPPRASRGPQGPFLSPPASSPRACPAATAPRRPTPHPILPRHRVSPPEPAPTDLVVSVFSVLGKNHNFFKTLDVFFYFFGSVFSV